MFESADRLQQHEADQHLGARPSQVVALHSGNKDQMSRDEQSSAGPEDLAPG